MKQRTLLFTGFFICALLIAAALYFQYVADLEPCPLCILQRVAFFILGLVFLCWALHNPARWQRYIYGVLSIIAGGFGIAVAARHVWLQNLPESQVPECGPGLDFIMQTLPFQRAIATIFKGSGECAEIKWTLFSMTMPSWSLIWLLLLTTFALWILIKPLKK